MGGDKSTNPGDTHRFRREGTEYDISDATECMHALVDASALEPSKQLQSQKKDRLSRRRPGGRHSHNRGVVTYSQRPCKPGGGVISPSLPFHFPNYRLLKNGTEPATPFSELNLMWRNETRQKYS